MDKVIERTVALLLLINAAVICWVAGSMALQWSGWSSEVLSLPQDTVGGPEQHLPLAGMNGADYPPKEACPCHEYLPSTLLQVITVPRPSISIESRNP